MLECTSTCCDNETCVEQDLGFESHEVDTQFTSANVKMTTERMKLERSTPKTSENGVIYNLCNII